VFGQNFEWASFELPGKLAGASASATPSSLSSAVEN